MSVLEPGPRAAPFLRRQLFLAGLAAVVVCVALLLVATVLGDGTGHPHAALRPSSDGTGVVPVSPLAETSRTSTWAVGVALAAVGVLVVLSVHHAVRVARFAVSDIAGRGRTPAGDGPVPDPPDHERE